jgi:hypothetical protein
LQLIQSTIQPEQKMKTKNMTTLPIGKSISRSLLRRGFILIAVALACFALAPAPNGFGVSPPPDGGYGGGNTAEGTNALFSRTTGVWNTALGYQALYHVTTGNQNTATGFQTLFSTTTGSLSVANGSQALYSNTTGSFNTATGFRTLYSNTTAFDNTGNGYEALAFNVTGRDNTATGFRALYNNDGDQNTANGSQALSRNTDGSDNAATGFKALFNDTMGGSNTANGSQALFSNTSGSSDTATGFQALFSNTMGNFNTANGSQALFSNTTGITNNATGNAALTSNTTGTGNNAFGASALLLNVVGSNNTAIGDTAGAQITQSGNVCIGEGVQGVAGENDTTRIRNIYASVASDRAVYVNSDNKLGTLMSSRRFKDEIKPMNKASEALLGLKPVTFRYKQELDPHHIPMFGLIAEEVEKVNPDLVTRNKKGEAETVRYDAINAMLLNEFLKEHRKMQKLEATIAKQQKQIEALTTGLQKVSDQLEVNSPRRARQTAFNDQ